jgi:flagellar biosynthesis/type III secretory pathway chaperone
LNELNEYYESLLEIFTTSGWKHFEEDLKRSLENLNTLQNISDSETFWHRKGEVSVLQTLLGYKDAITAAYEEMQDAESV